MASSRDREHCWRQGRHGVRSACGFVSRRPQLPSPVAQVCLAGAKNGQNGLGQKISDVRREGQIPGNPVLPVCWDDAAGGIITMRGHQNAGMVPGRHQNRRADTKTQERCPDGPSSRPRQRAGLELAAEAGFGDVELGAVFGDGTAGDFVAALGEAVDEFVVG